MDNWHIATYDTTILAHGWDGTVTVDWSQIFEKWGIKRVARTDKNKQAYVLSAEQHAAVIAAGIAPSRERPATPFTVVTPLDHAQQNVTSSFYYSQRSVQADREPEPRMGRELIRLWLQLHEEVLIGNIGQSLYAIKLDSAAGITTEEAMQEIARRSPRSTVLALAQKAVTRPAWKTTQRTEFARNPYVVAAAIHRANNACEMPGCTATLFARVDGSSYLEVHHVVPLSEKGSDRLENVAALCPHCHRQQHHGKDRVALRRKLQKHIRSLALNKPAKH